MNPAARNSKLNTLGRVVKSVAGYEGLLPDTYGMKADDLAALMNRRRTRYASREEPG